MTDIRPVTTEAGLLALLARHPLQPFLQSWAWGEFQRAWGRRIWRLGAFDGERLVGAALIVEHRLTFGKTYLYCPRGPLAMTAQVFCQLLEAVRDLGRRAGAMYVKVDPGHVPFAGLSAAVPADFTAGTTLQPQRTLLIDVSRPAPDLLAAMHPKTRYNIRLAEKKGVAIRWSTTDEDFETFLALIRQTYARQGIRLHPDGYYAQLFKTLRAAGMVELAMGEWNGRPFAANMVIWHGQTATYLHGGSSTEHKEVMMPHLTQWRTIERAKERGVSTYDLWGIAPDGQPQHKWAGVTRFKKGFGGRIDTFPPSLNAVVQPSWYWAYRLAKRMRGGVDA